MAETYARRSNASILDVAHATVGACREPISNLSLAYVSDRFPDWDRFQHFGYIEEAASAFREDGLSHAAYIAMETRLKMQSGD